MTDNDKTVREYHVATKHHVHRYARSLGYLDWATQPNPFRRFAGAPLLLLPFREVDDSPPYDAIFEPEQGAARPLSIHTLAEFFECSLAISAWKEYGGNRWALRCNPSSGNLHPTEGYLVAPAMNGLRERPGVYHYAPREHGLELRTEFSEAAWGALSGAFPDGTFFVGLSSIHWREAWKYGERAYRYCQHDIGHALAAVVLSAASLGWGARVLDALGDEAVSSLLGLDRSEDFQDAEGESPDLLAAVYPLPQSRPVPRELPISDTVRGPWMGRANTLSPGRVQWERIDAVTRAAIKPLTLVARVTTPVEPPTGAVPAPPRPRGETAKQIILRRRSAVDMDGHTAIPRDSFFHMLWRTMPIDAAIPWSAFGPPVDVHLGLFVHRVTRIPSGLYCLVRCPADRADLQASMSPAFHWKNPPGCPEALPLYLLQPGDYRQTATYASCGQDIAGDGAFSVGMIARFDGALCNGASWRYRRLFWETGMIGQVLYLEAEAAGVRGTGIGCFFDDVVHQVFGLEGTRYQSLYHFTVGGAVDDPRLITGGPYSAQRRLEPHAVTSCSV